MIRRKILLLPLTALLAGFGSCHKDPEWTTKTYETVLISRQPAEVPLPSGLWEKLHNVGSNEPVAAAPEKSGEHGSAGATGIKPKTEPVTEFASVTMFMVEKNEGILGGKNLRLEFPQGGGEIDLADFVQPLNGSFYVLFQFEGKLMDAPRGVFFLSGTVPRKVGKDSVGSDCNKYFDITSSVLNAAKGQGLLVNTTDRRHVSALAGTYFFAAMSPDRTVHIASILIRDRNSRDLECHR
jgi:hypothetical protein